MIEEVLTMLITLEDQYVNRGPKPNLLCKNCVFISHTIERCYELIGYPLGFKKISNLIKQSCFKQSFNVGASTYSLSFTSNQMEKLLSLINENPSRSIHANMASMASFLREMFV